MIRRFFSTCKKLHKPWAVSKDGVVKCEPLTTQSLDGAIKVMWESFFKMEPLCKAVDILKEPGAAEELLQTCYDAAKDGVSIVANDTSTNKIVGVIFNKIQVVAPKGESYYEKLRRNCKHESVKAFYDFTIDFETKADIFKQYNANCLIEIMYIATLPDHRNRNIGWLLALSASRMARQLYSGENVKTPIYPDDGKITNADAVPTIITAMVTSVYSQKLGVKLGYDNVLEVKYDDYVIHGKTISEKIGDEHKTCRLIVKRLDSFTNL